MGASPELPPLATVGEGLKGIPRGSELESMLYDRFKTGLPQSVLDSMLKRGKAGISGNLESGNQRLEEMFAGNSGTPLDALIGGKRKLQADANNSITDLNDTILARNEEAKGDAYNKLLALFGLGGGLAGDQNAYNLNKYQIDEENSFSFGDFLGNLLGAAGGLGSAFIMKPK